MSSRTPCTAAVVVALALAAPATTSAAVPSDRTRADAVMTLSAPAFVVQRSFAVPFDWSNDGCSNPLPVNANDLFHAPCVQHDFGYRNYGARGRLRLDPRADRRRWIDDRFLVEMLGVCDGRYSGARRTACRATARVYWVGVRTFGARAFG